MKIIFKFFIIASIIFTISFSSVFADETFNAQGPSKDVLVGESFSIPIYVSSPRQAINAVSGLITISGGVSISNIKYSSSIIDFWTNEPKIVGNQIKFEGIILNPGYQGKNGLLFNISLLAKKEGPATISFSEGSILANDGLGSNIIDFLQTTSFQIKSSLPVKVDTIPSRPIASNDKPTKALALPVITEYSPTVDADSYAFLKGKGEPYAITKIAFTSTDSKSLGEQFIASLQTKKAILDDVLLKNNKEGLFEYISPNNLVAGAYNATPYLVDSDKQTEKPGFGVSLLVSDNKIVRFLVILVNILLLLIPIVGLLVLIYFIPWYSRLRMRLVKKKLHLEEEKIQFSESAIDHHHGHLFDER